MKVKLLFIVFICGISFRLLAQANSDPSMIIQKCIDLPSLHAHYPTQPDGVPEYLYAVNNNNFLNNNIDVNRFGTKLNIVPISFILENKITSYFNFKEIHIDATKAIVDLQYSFIENELKKSISILLNFEKVENSWVIIDKKFKEDQNEK
ncbi:MAG: hypothetical protein JEZ03_12945 [Bacteroidales bacterium]|nr:hypothetical protein [Bacteroidales bacterium]